MGKIQTKPLEYIPLGESLSALVEKEDPVPLFGKLTKIDEGKFGVVYKAKNSKTNTIVAIKVIPVTRDIKQDNLSNEINIFKTCNHSNIVKFHSAFTSKGNIWIIMELMEGGNLAKLNHLVKFSEEEISYILKEILESLKYLHSMYILHRDIKTHNVTIGRNGEIKVTDFGFSCQLKDSSELRKSSMGTALYMAPEIMKNEEYSFKSDVWSIGIIAIELCEGEPPHKDIPSALRIMHRVVTSPSPKLKERKDGKTWSKEIIDFVDKCVDKDQKNRATIDELLNHDFIKKSKDMKPDFLVKYLQQHKIIN